MDANVSARFFRLSAQPPGTLDFPELLLAELAKPRTAREHDVTGTGVTVRVEHCIADGDFVVGEFCRKQMTNIPPQAGPDGLTPIALPNGQGLGHLAAFRFHRPTRVILLQNNPQCVTTYRVALYVMKLNAAAVFGFAPVLREDALERFKDKKVRSFSVQFASPKNLEALDDQGIPSAKGARLLAEAYHGFKLTFTVSVGKRKKKFLDFNRVSADITALLGSDAEIRKLKVGTKEVDDDDPGIDFLREHLKSKQTLDLPEGNPADNYEVRKAYLMTEFAGKLPYLMKHFGPEANEHAG
jgi:hypothetical protein